MKVEDGVLILDSEVNDEMMDEFLNLSNSDDVKSVLIETDNISSLVIQQLFCLKETKEVVCNDEFLAKFFDDVKLVS